MKFSLQKRVTKINGLTSQKGIKLSAVLMEGYQIIISLESGY
jgi:hypothetical protein